MVVDVNQDLSASLGLGLPCVNSLLLIYRDNYSCGKIPPAHNVPEPALATPSQPMEDTSVATSIRLAVKRRARCHGPSCEVHVMRSHQLSLPNRSASESGVRSFYWRLTSPTWTVAQTWHGSTWLSGESLRSFLMNFPASRSRVQNGSQPASRNVRRRCFTLSSMSWGARNVAVSESESRSVPSYPCILVALRSHLLT